MHWTMTLRVAHGFLLTPAPWLSAAARPVEPLRAVVLAARVLSSSAAEADRASEPVLPAPVAELSDTHARRVAQAYARARDPLQAYAPGAYLRVRA